MPFYETVNLTYFGHIVRCGLFPSIRFGYSKEESDTLKESETTLHLSTIKGFPLKQNACRITEGTLSWLMMNLYPIPSKHPFWWQRDCGNQNFLRPNPYSYPSHLNLSGMISRWYVMWYTVQLPIWWVVPVRSPHKYQIPLGAQSTVPTDMLF